MINDLYIVADPEFKYQRYPHLSLEVEYEINFNDWHRMVQVEKELAYETQYTLEEAKEQFRKLWGWKMFDNSEGITRGVYSELIS
tara:strand:+ start:445 stop:699 length:255 start_codon:yes stop_codon:yes gene_type:complete